MRSPLDSLRVDCGINRYCCHQKHTEYQEKIIFVMFIFPSYVLSCLTRVFGTDKHAMVFSADTEHDVMALLLRADTIHYCSSFQTVCLP